MSRVGEVSSSNPVQTSDSVAETKNTGRISEGSLLHGEVGKASKGTRSFFYHPATIAILSVLTAGLYGLGLLIHHACTGKSKCLPEIEESPATETPSLVEDSSDASRSWPELEESPATETGPAFAPMSIPKIHNADEFKAYIMGQVTAERKKDSQLPSLWSTDDVSPKVGYSFKLGSTTREGKEVNVYGYNGLVFRFDRRLPNAIFKAGGFKSKQGLSASEVPKEVLDDQGSVILTRSESEREEVAKANRMEAMGLGDGLGATGQSGVSCADRWEMAVSYGGFGENCGRLYVIDTTKLGKGDMAFHMTQILLENGLKARDESSGEVNITSVPIKAIVGWVQVDQDLGRNSSEAFTNGITNGILSIEFNEKYVP